MRPELARAWHRRVAAWVVAVASVKLVDPGSPDTSYLIWKLDGGGGSCFLGTRMPKTGAVLTLAQILLFRDWITNGAPEN